MSIRTDIVINAPVKKAWQLIGNRSVETGNSSSGIPSGWKTEWALHTPGWEVTLDCHEPALVLTTKPNGAAHHA